MKENDKKKLIKHLEKSQEHHGKALAILNSNPQTFTKKEPTKEAPKKKKAKKTKK